MKSVNQAIRESFGRVPEKKFIENRYCDGCQRDIKIFEMPIIGGPDKGKMMTIRDGCKCADKKLAHEKVILANQEKKKQNLIRAFNRNSLINPDLLKATFDNFQPGNADQKNAWEASKRYVADFQKEDPRNLSLHGNPSVGKSHLAKAIADGVIERGFTSIFITLPTLFRKLRSTYDKDSEISEDKMFTMLEQVDVLILDDVGTEKETKWTYERIFELINARQGKHTIYTTNYSPAHLERILGERLYSRMMYNTEIVEIRAENYRLKDQIIRNADSSHKQPPQRRF